MYYVASEGAWFGKSRALGRVVDPQAAEENAIIDALEYGITFISGSGHIEDFAVRCDALWLVNAIRGHRYGSAPSCSRAIQEIVCTIHKLEALKTRVVVEWVSAHSGIEGNEQADAAAKDAKIRSPLTIHGGAALTMPVMLWSPSPEEVARYRKPPGLIEFSREHDRLLLNAASDRSKFTLLAPCHEHC